jgi:hypothetical protein
MKKPWWTKGLLVLGTAFVATSVVHAQLLPGYRAPPPQPAIYRQAGWGDAANPIHKLDDCALADKFDAKDGFAAWHLAMREAARRHMTAAKYYAVASAALLHSGEPIMHLLTNYLADVPQEEEALPYLLFARQLGVDRGMADAYLCAWQITSAQLAASQGELTSVFKVAEPFAKSARPTPLEWSPTGCTSSTNAAAVVGVGTHKSVVPMTQGPLPTTPEDGLFYPHGHPLAVEPSAQCVGRDRAQVGSVQLP